MMLLQMLLMLLPFAVGRLGYASCSCVVRLYWCSALVVVSPRSTGGVVRYVCFGALCDIGQHACCVVIVRYTSSIKLGNLVRYVSVRRGQTSILRLCSMCAVGKMEGWE